MTTLVKEMAILTVLCVLCVLETAWEVIWKSFLVWFGQAYYQRQMEKVWKEIHR